MSTANVIAPYPDFSHLRESLTTHRYTAPELTQLLGLNDVWEIILKQDLAVEFARCLGDTSPVGRLAQLFLLHQDVPRQDVEALVGPEVFEWFLERKLFSLQGEWVESQVDLNPCLGLFVFTDPRLIYRAIPNYVYRLGSDSYALARAVPRPSGEQALDLCTGSGVHALLAARHHLHVTGVDLNPKAVQYARLNAHLNQLGKRCTFVRGDLYEPVQGRTFDYITANPPFVATPELDMEVHRTGGESGEEIVARLVAGLPSHL